jgi:hypothetical protein
MGAENERLWREHCERTDRPKDGGSAFPVTPTDRSWQIADTQMGMSLRDYFAAAAMQGMLASPDGDGHVERHAVGAYQIADAMLAARARKEGSNG